MATVKCPYCGAFCDSTDKVCHACGQDLKTVENKEKNITQKKSELNKLESNINEPSWVSDLRNEYKHDKKISIIAIIIFNVLFVTFLLLTIFNKVEKEVYGYKIQDINPIWFIGMFVFLLFAFIAVISFFINDQKITAAEVVDGYYVVGHGTGRAWSLIIEGVEVDSIFYGKYTYSDRSFLKGTLPNKQKIHVYLGAAYKNFMKVEKVKDGEGQ